MSQDEIERIRWWVERMRVSAQEIIHAAEHLENVYLKAPGLDDGLGGEDEGAA